jgi:hypothetical protein
MTYTHSNEKIGYVYNKSEVKQGNTAYYYNDAGIIYSNLLYLVKIIVKVENQTSTGEYITNDKPLIFYRWLWTNTLFNNNYHSNLDFNHIQPTLYLDLNCSYNTHNSEDDGLVPWEVIQND